jgi:hypothetical protein
MGDDQTTARHTGEKAKLLARARKAAQHKITSANQQRTDRIAAAKRQAQATLDAAHSNAMDILGKYLKNVCFATEQSAVLTDARGEIISNIPTEGASNVAVDAGAQRIYWPQVGGAIAMPMGVMPQTQAENLKQGEVALYDLEVFPGRVWVFSAAVGDFRAFQGLDDRVSSVRVGPNTQLTLFEKADFQGMALKISGQVRALREAGFAGGASSLSIQISYGDLKPGEVILYEKMGGEGRSWRFNTDAANLSAQGVPESLLSLRVGPNTALTLYEQVEFQGKSRVFAEDTNSLRDFVGGIVASSPWVTTRSLKIAGSVIVPRRGEVALYERKNYQGQAWIFNVPVSDFQKTSGLFGRVSSVRAGSGTSITLFDRAGFDGNYQTFGQDIPSLADTSIGKAGIKSMALGPRFGSLEMGDVMLYEKENFQGRFWVFKNEVANFDSFDGLRGPIGSILPGPYTSVTLYAGADFQGGSVEFVDEMPSVNWPRTGLKGVGSLKTGRAHPRLELMSVGIDGSNESRLASLPIRQTAAGSIVLDTESQSVYWILPSGACMRCAVSDGGVAKIFDAPVSPTTNRWGLAVDKVNKKIYWSSFIAIGSAGLDGSGLTTIINNLPGDVPISLQVDGESGYLYWNNGREIWRVRLDGSGAQPIYRSQSRLKGLALDLATQLLYWVEKGTLVTAVADGSVKPKNLFALPSANANLPDLISNLSLVTASGAANQRLQDAQAKRQQAQASAADAIDKAHKDATERRRIAQENLNKAHDDSSKKISDKQQDAVNSRQAAQSDLSNAHRIADQEISGANADATGTRQQAYWNAQRIKDDANRKADDITRPAQQKLDDARRKKQSS